MATLSSSLKKIFRLYLRGGFVVKTLLMDMEFECLKDEFDVVTVNTTAAREHVGEIERMIRVIKERCRCVLGDLRRAGYRFFHKWIIVHCAYFVTMMINALPSPKVFRVCTHRENSSRGRN